MHEHSLCLGIKELKKNKKQKNPTVSALKKITDFWEEKWISLIQRVGCNRDIEEDNKGTAIYKDVVSTERLQL